MNIRIARRARWQHVAALNMQGGSPMNDQQQWLSRYTLALEDQIGGKSHLARVYIVPPQQKSSTQGREQRICAYNEIICPHLMLTASLFMLGKHALQEVSVKFPTIVEGFHLEKLEGKSIFFCSTKH